jgi:hypothetical protein
MRKLLHALSFTGLSALGLIASSAQAGVVLFQDGFDSDLGTSSLNFMSFNNWDVSNGTVDYIRSPNGWGINCVTGCLDMDGSTGNGGRITSKTVYNFLATHSYKLSVDVSGNQRTSTIENLIVGITGNLSAININPGNLFTTYSTVISGFAGLASLIFETSSNDNVGAILDNVAFECTTCQVSSVPEPGIFGLFALGLAGLGLSRKRTAIQVA